MMTWNPREWDARPNSALPGSTQKQLPCLRCPVFCRKMEGGRARESKPQVWLGGRTRRLGTTSPPPSSQYPPFHPPLSKFSGAKPQNAQNGPLGKCHLSPGPQPPLPHTMAAVAELP